MSWKCSLVKKQFQGNGKLEKNSEKDTLQEEAHAFDKQILERIAAGHIPDLRRAGECTYFYNNSWRHPDYIRLDFGEQVDLILKAIHKFIPPPIEAPKVLEVGCGPGHISLELARNHLDVTGIDISPTCIHIANRFALEDPWNKDRGPLRYLQGDFLNNVNFPLKSFDVVLFVGALHHFSDQGSVGRKVRALLKDEGIIMAHEPTRDRMTKGNAVFIHLLRSLLSAGGNFYSCTDIPEDYEQQRFEMEKIFHEMRYENERGENTQSINDNEAGFSEMDKMLQNTFTRLDFQERYAFFHEMIGGLRFPQHVNKRLARYLRDVDADLCRLGVLQPTEFFYVGQK